MNRIGKLLVQLILIVFLSLFMSKYTTEYNENKRILTEEAIIEYEKDLKDGKDIMAKKYVPEEKNYNNRAAKVGRKLSSMIEKVFHKGFQSFMRFLNQLQDE